MEKRAEQKTKSRDGKVSKWRWIGGSVAILFLLSGFLWKWNQVEAVSKNQEIGVTITNVSFDPTRELYENYNKAFANHWKQEKGENVEIIQSHGGSGKQARSVIEGNEVDVVTLALSYDITAIEKAGFIEPEWEKKLEGNSAPYTSTVVLLVRRGNPKNIKDWGDLIREDVTVITPSPKTSGGARWNYLGAWVYGLQQYDGNEEKTIDFMKKLYGNVGVLDSGARGATTTFTKSEQGDVLLAWENEAFLVQNLYPEEYEIIVPSISILAQPSVAVVDEVTKKRNTQEIAQEYLKYLYSEEGQNIIAKNYFRPRDEQVLKQYKDVFPQDIKLIEIGDESLGGWEAVQEKHFQDGGLFDQIYEDGK